MRRTWLVDDRAERLLMDLNDEHNQAMELQRASVDRRVWDLENELMEMRCGYESA